MKIYGLNIKSILSSVTLSSLYSYVSNEKKEKIKFYRNKIDAVRTLAAEVLCRAAIVENLNIKNRDIYFSVNKYGKPYLRFYKNFHFNLSHSGDWVICSIDCKDIGVDIEKVEPIDLDISKNFFSPKEYEDLINQNPNNQLFYFYDLWTIKESYIKASGKGLNLDLRSFSIRIKNGKISLETENELTNCFFQQYDIAKDYKMAVCALNSSFPEKIILRTIDDLHKTLKS